MDILSSILLILPTLLFGIGMIVYIVCRFQKKPKIYHVAECFLCWMSFSLVFPHFVKKYGFIKRPWISWVLTFISPAAWITYLAVIVIIYCFVIGHKERTPLEYNQLKYTSREDIVALTEIQDFPAFRYVTNSHSSRNGSATIKYEFEKPLSASMKNRLDSLCKASDNVFWEKNLISNQDTSFYGTRDVYVLERGWDGKYCKVPREGMSEDNMVTITIGEKGFTLYYQGNFLTAAIVDRDSLYNQTYIRFPKYDVLRCCFYDGFVDYSCEADLKLAEKPSKQFIVQLQDSPFFKQDKERPGVYCYSNEEKYVRTSIEVNVKTGIIHCTRGSE